MHPHPLSLSLPHSLAEKGLRGEASSSQGSRWNAGSLGTDPAVSPWESQAVGIPPADPSPGGDTGCQRQTPPPQEGGFVRVGKPLSKPQPGSTPEFSRPAVTETPLPRPPLPGLLQHNPRHCATTSLPPPLLCTPVQWVLCLLQHSGWR